MTALMTHGVRAITDGWMAFLRGLSSNYGIKFVIGQAPATDGKTVYLPSLPMNLTADDLVIFKSNGFHEIGHVMHSNIAFFQAFAKQHGDFGRFLLNALDDVFMENKQARTVKQSAHYFRKSVDLLFERGMFRDGSASAAEAVACYALCFTGAQYWSEYSRPLAVVTENFNRHFGEHADIVRGNLNEVLLNEFPNVASTEQAGALALRILAMLKSLGAHEEKRDEKQEPKEDGQGKPGDTSGAQGQGTPGNGEKSEKSESKPGQQSGADQKNPGSTGGQPEQSGAKSGEKGPDETVKDGGSSKAAGNGTEEGKGSGSSLKQIVDEIINATGLGDAEVFDQREAVKEISSSISRGVNPDYKGQSVVPSCVIDGKLEVKGVPGKGAGVGEVVDGISVCQSDRSEAAEMVARLGRKPQVLASRLQALLLQQEEAESFVSMRGQLGNNHLHNVALGSVRVFVQQEEAERPTTAVSLVLDLSGSTMDSDDKEFASGGSPQFTAAKQASTLRSILESAVMLEKVLDQIGSPREILGFAPRKGELMSMVRSFGDNHQTALARLGGLRRIAGGSHTPIAEAVFHAGRRLVAHDANRKVMFVLTDGMPSNRAKAVEMTKVFEESGVRVIYLVIGSSGDSTWLADAGIPFATVESSEDICPVLLNEAKKLLS